MYFEHATNQLTLGCATDATLTLYETRWRLLKELWKGKRHIRQLGVLTTKVKQEGGYQYNLFDCYKYDRLEKLDQAVDCIRERYGEDAIRRATFLGSRFEHMGGGISRVKNRNDESRQIKTPWEEAVMK